MPKSFVITSPDGRQLQVTPPEGATQEQIQDAILKVTGQSQLGSVGTVASAALGGRAGGVTTAADVAMGRQTEAQALIDREINANEMLSDAKRQLAANAIPLGAGAIAAPFTSGMSLPAALGTQAAVGAGAETARQLVAGEDLNPYRIGGEGAIGAGFEGFGRGVGWLLKAAKGALPKAIKPEDAMVFTAAQRAGAPLLASEVTGGPLSKFFTRWTEKSVWGEPAAIARREKIADAVGRYVTAAMDVIAKPTSPVRTAEGLSKLSKVIRSGWDDVAGELFSEARAAAPAGKVIDLTDVVDKAKELLARRGNLRAEMPGTLKALTGEDKVLQDFLADAEKFTPERVVPSSLVGPNGQSLPGQVIPAERTVKSLTVEQATELRKLVNEKYYAYLSDKDRQAAKMMKEFEKTFDESLAAQVGGPNSEYMKKLGAAKRFYKEGYDLWDTAVMSELLNKDPSRTLASVNVLDPQVQKTLSTVFTKWGNKQAGVDLVRRQALQNIIQDATMSSGGQGLVSGVEVELKPAALKNALKRLEPDSRAFIFGGTAGLEVERRLAEAISIAERVEKVQGGQSAGRLLSNAAMMAWGLAHQSGAMVGAAAASITAPKLFARLMGEPISSLHMTRALKYAEKGFTSPRFWSLYAQETGRALEAFRQTQSYREMTGEAQSELAAIQAERQQKGIPQRSRPDR